MYQIISVQNKRLLRYARNDPSLIPPLVRGTKGGCFLSLRGVSATKQSHFLKPIKSKDERIKGDHHILTKPDIIEIINNEEPCGKTAGYLNVRNFSLSYSLAIRFNH